MKIILDSNQFNDDKIIIAVNDNIVYRVDTPFYCITKFTIVDFFTDNTICKFNTFREVFNFLKDKDFNLYSLENKQEIYDLVNKKF